MRHVNLTLLSHSRNCLLTVGFAESADKDRDCSNLFLLPVFVIAVIPSPGLDQSHVSPLNPFLTPGPPAFSFSPFGNYNI